MKVWILCLIGFINISHAGVPVWTFEPLTSTNINIARNGTASVEYRVTNQSKKSHTLTLNGVQGISQDTSNGYCQDPFVLGYQQSCILKLNINAIRLLKNISSGPVVCERASTNLECYQPSPQNLLKITILSIYEYTIIPSADSNGSITPSTTQIVNGGANLEFSATPNSGYQVFQWKVDGGIAQTGGINFTLNNIQANHTVLVSFTPTGTHYAGAQNGNVYYSTNSGINWNATPQTPSSNADPVFLVLATANALYAASTNQSAVQTIYYSTSNGTSWTTSLSSPNYTTISVLPGNNLSSNELLYVGQNDGRVFYQTVVGGTPTYTGSNPCSSSAVTALFAAGALPPNTTLYAGCENGSVKYSNNNGSTWSQYSQSPDGYSIGDIFVSNAQVFLNTQLEYMYTNSLGGTSLSNPWSTFAQTVFSFFADPTGEVIIAGTQGGFVYSLSTGDSLGFITYSPINSVFFLRP